MEATGRAGDVKITAKDVLPMPATGDAVVNDQPHHHRAGVVDAIVDVFTGMADPPAKLRHAIPRLAAVSTFVAASAGRPHILDVALGATAHAGRSRERGEGMSFLEKMDGLVQGPVAFDAVIPRSLSGNDLRVLLRSGAGQIDLREDLIGEIVGSGSDGEEGESE